MTAWSNDGNSLSAVPFSTLKMLHFNVIVITILFIKYNVNHLLTHSNADCRHHVTVATCIQHDLSCCYRQCMHSPCGKNPHIRRISNSVTHLWSFWSHAELQNLYPYCAKLHAIERCEQCCNNWAWQWLVKGTLPW